MQASYSRIETFKQCPYKYKLSYIDDLTTYEDDSYNNALYLGQGLHVCIQENIKNGLECFYNNYHIVTDDILSEGYKLELLATKARSIVPCNGYAEVEINTVHFKGFIDWLVPTSNGHFDLYDFKYCNGKNASKYLDSAQLHLYKYFYEQTHKGVIDNLYYLIVPKTGIRKKDSETIEQFRLRIKDECDKIQPYLLKVDFDINKVKDFLNSVSVLENTTSFEKVETNLCHWCEFENYCKNGDTSMILPKNERRKIDGATRRRIWIYGLPFSGKTYFANQFESPLMLNTDGNINYVDAPYIAIKNDVTVDGRLTKTTYAWEVFKDTIKELEKKQNDFKTIIVDLLEDTYEYCRLYMYNQLGITHESDDSFRAWDKVRTEFLSTIKRLMNLDYENIILISHEDASRDLTSKSGSKVSAIKPNIQDKLANKIAGMVDIVARVVADKDTNSRTLEFKSDNVIFGGGRLNIKVNSIPLDIKKFDEVYQIHARPTQVSANIAQTETVAEPTQVVEPTQTEVVETMGNVPTEEEPKPRTRRRREVVAQQQDDKLPF